jgi:hypothetical protein
VKQRKLATAARRIRIQFHAGWNRDMDVEQEFELPAGSNSATAIVSLPTFQNVANNYFWWDVWVDGILDKDLSVERAATLSWMGNFSGNASGLTFLVPGPANDHRSLVTTSSMEFDVLTLELAKFPTRWIDYTTIDVIALSFGELTQLKEEQPAAFDAVARWIRAGGQLWVSDVGKEFQDLPALSTTLHISETLLLDDVANNAIAKVEEKPKKDKADGQATSTPVADNAGDSDTAMEIDADQPNTSFGWRPLRFSRVLSDGRVAIFYEQRTGNRRTVRDPAVIERLEQDPNYTKMEETYEPVAGSAQRRASDSSQWYVEQSLGLGTVRAFRGANEVTKFARATAVANPNAATAANGAAEKFTQPLEMGLLGTERWDSRHGMTPDSGNVEFAKFFVPGVGRAPVTAFEVLITVFVLLIGPVNYWLLRRYKRIHLMVLTVPLAAVVTTLALFAYAIVADGFASRVRARSFTTLDQRTGDAASWTWLSYYSGLAPGDGLTMPADIAMYPIQPAWASDNDLMQERGIVWEGDAARLTHGWLNSRTPTQYLTVRSRKSPHQLEVQQSGDKLRVKNKLGTTIKTLVVVGEKGGLYFGENIPNDSLTPLAPIERGEAIQRIGRLYTENLPKAPEELATSDADLMAMTSGSRYRRYGRYGGQFSGGRLLDNLAGSATAELAGRTDQPGLDLPPRSYVAITETGPEVEVGMSHATEEASFHMIEGKW